MTAIGRDVPDFAAGDGRWVTMPTLMLLLGVTRPRINQLREQFQGAFEHVDEQAKGKPVYFFAPAWLAAWSDARRGTSAAPRSAEVVPTDHAERLKKAQADTAEHHLARLRGEVISLAELNEILVSVLGAFRRAGDQMGRISPEAQRLMVDALVESRDSYRALFNGHSDKRITEPGGTEGVRRGVRRRPPQDSADAS